MRVGREVACISKRGASLAKRAEANEERNQWAFLEGPAVEDCLRLTEDACFDVADVLISGYADYLIAEIVRPHKLHFERLICETSASMDAIMETGD